MTEGTRRLVLLFALSSFAGIALAQDSPRPTVANNALRLELLKRLEQDQAIRNELIPTGIDRLSEADRARWRAIDEDNTARMKVVVGQYGWPGPALVGQDGAEAAFMLVQHADHAFQVDMLPFVKKAYAAGELRGQDYALLQDRVLVGDGKPQIYGTQFKIVGGELIIQPIEDEAGVDRRRADVGLPPLAEYVAMAKRMYSSPSKPQ
jgi:hypothetical protein